MSSNRDSERHVVITGIGIVSPIGIGNEQFWESLSAGRTGIAPLESIPSLPIPHRIAGEVRKFEASKFAKTKDQRKALKVMCREIQLGVVSASLALDHAGLAEDDGVVKSSVDHERLGVEFGANLMLSPPDELARACFSCVDEVSHRFELSRWKKEDSSTGGMAAMFPLWLLKFLPNMPACHIGIAADARGPNNSITLDEASGNVVLGEALRVIARGSADVMISGTTGTRVHAVKSIHAAMWDSLGDICRPFDLNRTGQVIGEGACTLILEEQSHAENRGAKILGSILGAGSRCVFHRDGRPDIRRALVLSMKAALADAGVTPEQIGHINAHGLGTKVTDQLEAEAIHEVFGSHASTVPVTAFKSYLGNAGSGCGMLEMAGSLVGLAHGVIPATQGYQTADPACNLNVVHGQPLSTRNPLFLKINVTRMGQAGAIVASGPTI